MDQRASTTPHELVDRPVQLQGSRWARVFLRWLGWQLDFNGLPARQGVVVVYPHTSNWDLLYGALAKWAIGMPIVFWGKHSLFSVPLLGAWLRWIGGVPVNRDAPGGIVGEMTQRMKRAREHDDFLWLALAPEGTRSKGSGWRSGFHRVAVGAGVPVALAYIDFGPRRVGIGTCLQLSGDAKADLAAIAERYAGVRGYRPDLAAPVQFS